MKRPNKKRSRIIGWIILGIILIGIGLEIGFAALNIRGLDWFHRITIIDPLFTSSELDIAELESAYREYLVNVPESAHENYPTEFMATIGNITRAQKEFFNNPNKEAGSVLIAEYKNAQREYKDFFRAQRQKIADAFGTENQDRPILTATGAATITRDRTLEDYDYILKNANALREEIQNRECILSPSINCVLRPEVWQIVFGQKKKDIFFASAPLEKNTQLFSYDELRRLSKKDWGEQARGPYFIPTACFAGKEIREPFYVTDAPPFIKWAADNLYFTAESWAERVLNADTADIDIDDNDAVFQSEKTDYICPAFTYQMALLVADDIRSELQGKNMRTEAEERFLQTLDWSDVMSLAYEYQERVNVMNPNALLNTPELLQYHRIVNKLNAAPRVLRHLGVTQNVYYRITDISIRNTVQEDAQKIVERYLATQGINPAIIQSYPEDKLKQIADKQLREKKKNSIYALFIKGDAAFFSFSFSSAFWRINEIPQFIEGPGEEVKQTRTFRLSEVDDKEAFAARIFTQTSILEPYKNDGLFERF